MTEKTFRFPTKVYVKRALLNLTHFLIAGLLGQSALSAQASLPLHAVHQTSSTEGFATTTVCCVAEMRCFDSIAVIEASARTNLLLQRTQELR